MPSFDTSQRLDTAFLRPMDRLLFWCLILRSYHLLQIWTLNSYPMPSIPLCQFFLTRPRRSFPSALFHQTILSFPPTRIQSDQQFPRPCFWNFPRTSTPNRSELPVFPSRPKPHPSRPRSSMNRRRSSLRRLLFCAAAFSSSFACLWQHFPFRPRMCRRRFVAWPLRTSHMRERFRGRSFGPDRFPADSPTANRNRISNTKRSYPAWRNTPFFDDFRMP
mmetsp:Transcript_25184/g.59393  ORF Transcript_25184/g.59393 Transcript_25184/m.59393 type:complete len:219 (+) Transcript_25184:1192-1848(+)